MSPYIPSLTIGGLVLFLMLLMLSFEFQRYSSGTITRRLLIIRILSAVTMSVLAFSVTLGTMLLVNERRLAYAVWLVVVASVLAVLILIITDLRSVRALYREQRRRILQESDAQAGDDDDRRG